MVWYKFNQKIYDKLLMQSMQVHNMHMQRMQILR